MTTFVVLTFGRVGQLLDDCTMRMKMNTFASKLFTPDGNIIQGKCC